MTADSTQVSTALMNDGKRIPTVGLGVYLMSAEDAVPAIRHAIEAGYRHIDTAAIYQNEEAVGRAINEAISAGDVSREELFVTTKLWNNQHHEAEAALEQSLQRLGLDYVDLYLIHWPSAQQGLYVQAFEGMLRAQDKGLITSVGVSNFYPKTLEDLISQTGVVPVVNQVESHPGFSQEPLRAVHEQRGIVTEAWSPLGQGKSDLLSHPVLVQIAEEHGKTPAQVALRWQLQRNVVVIPKSVTPARISENIDLFGFELSPAELAEITALDESTIAGRIGPDPENPGF